MNKTLRIFFLFSSLNLSHAATDGLEPQLLYGDEAMAIISFQEEAAKIRASEFRIQLKRVPSISEYSFYKEGSRVLHRRVEPPQKQEQSTSVSLTESVSVESKTIEPERLWENHRHETLSFSVTNYDDLYSEITWRDTETKNKYSVWTNVSLVHLPMLSSFELDDVNYSYFGFPENIDSEAEKERTGPHYFNGRRYEYESRWKESPVVFAKEPEYVVIAEEDGTIVPEKLYENMDAVLRYYLENEESLRISHLNSAALSRAREEYLRKNPPQPEESVLIYSFTPSADKPVTKQIK